ncbi:tandem-95 repeat protein [Candidatus Poribacteria bacterium]|nr:tandem-95 repeat protein [Candidatus Poribacteria bacterium]
MGKNMNDLYKKHRFLILFIALIFVTITLDAVAIIEVKVEPEKTDVIKDEIFTVDINVYDVSNLMGYQVNVFYDPEILEVVSVEEGTLLPAENKTCVPLNLTVAGQVGNIACTALGANSVNGDGTVGTITFKALDVGESQISVNDLGAVEVKFVNEELVNLDFTIQNATINVGLSKPVVSDIPDQTIQEGENFTNISLDDFVTDDDNTDAEITWTYSGSTDLNIAINNRTATVTTPDEDWNGSETITFTATDPNNQTDSDEVVFTVNPVNDAPVISAVDDVTVEESDSVFTFSIPLDDIVNDIDNDNEEIEWTFSGNVDLVVEISPDRVMTVTGPDVDWNGSETITITATDPGNLSDSEDITFTVTGVNDAPVVSDIPDQTIQEGENFTDIPLNDYVTDVDNDLTEIIWSYEGNTNLSLEITENVASITVTDENWTGSETITFTATDPDNLSHSDDVTFTVTDVNDAPVVSDIPDQTTEEGGIFTGIFLDNYVTDVDNETDEITWSYTGNTDLIVEITDNVVNVNIPEEDWTGSETVTFTATDPSGLSDSDDVTFTVTNVNDAPVVSDIPDQTIQQGETFADIALNDYVTDVDNEDAEITWSFTGNVDVNIEITDNIAAITTDASWTGSETITFTATDPDGLNDSDEVTFTVESTVLLGDVNGDGTVRSNDAILILRIAAGLMTPTDSQRLAADVNQDGNIRSNDAILVLRIAAGLAAPDIKRQAAGIVNIKLEEAYGLAGSRISVPLNIDRKSVLGGGDLSIVYDPNVLQAVEVNSVSDRLLMASRINDSGIIRISFAGAEMMKSGNIINLEFEILDDSSSEISIRDIGLYSLDGIPMNAVAVNGSFESWALAPEKTILFQNYPNPFNPETWIPFQLREQSEVKISIYNALGILVRELDLGSKAAGTYTSRDRAAYWDGLNDSGEKVSSGIYFYNIKTDKYSSVRKMTIVQ